MTAVQKKFIKMNCDFYSEATQKTESEHVRISDCESESKVVVQVLPSIELNSILALADTFRGISVKLKGKASPNSFEGEMQPSRDVDEVLGDISGFGQIYPKKNFIGTYSICPSNGMKLGDIKYIGSELAKSSSQVVRILHYLLFGIYGLVSTEGLLQQSRQNILQFSGFSFAEESDMHVKKEKTLLNLPYPLLVCIHRILINSLPVTRSSAVVTLIQFLQKPTDEYIGNGKPGKLQKELSDNEIKKLKSDALGAHPVVLLKRLKENFVEKSILIGEKKEETSIQSQTPAENYAKPSFIHNGTGVHLKRFPEIVNNVQRARRRIINLLHSLLFGRPGSDIKNRENILEFNGFTSPWGNFLARKMAFLKRLRTQDLLQLCNVFSLRVKAENRSKKINKLLLFLASPDKLNPHKRRRNKNAMKWNKMNAEFHYSKIKKADKGQSKKDSGDSICEKAANKPSVKLRDFDTIRSKVECATPDFLIELNDLLFVTPCDNSEIHQRILDFTSFSFKANSFDFHCRKTLMQYMDMKAVRKIAELLDIENWENCRSHQDLSKIILNFLMNMRFPDKKRKSAFAMKNKGLKHRPNIVKLCSCRDFSKSRSCSPENFDSTYASEEVKENDWESNVETPFTYYKNTAAQSSYHEHKNGLFSKHKHDLSDSTTLFEFIQHPTDKELYHQIDRIINIAPLSITLGDLVREVLKCYPNYNLHYKIDFIRNKALEVLQELRENIVIFPETESL